MFGCRKDPLKELMGRVHFGEQGWEFVENEGDDATGGDFGGHDA